MKLHDLLLLAAAVLLVIGAGLYATPAAFVVAGLCAVAAWVLVDDRGDA